MLYPGRCGFPLAGPSSSEYTNGQSKHFQASDSLRDRAHLDDYSALHKRTTVDEDYLIHPEMTGKISLEYTLIVWDVLEA